MKTNTERRQSFHESYGPDGTAKLRVIPNPAWHEGDHSHFEEEVPDHPSYMVTAVCALAVGAIGTGLFAAYVLILDAIRWIVAAF